MDKPKKIRLLKKKYSFIKESYREKPYLYNSEDNPRYDYRYLKRVHKLLKSQLYLHYDKIWSKRNLKVTASKLALIPKKISRGYELSTTIEPETYARLQDILMQVYGKPQFPDYFLCLLIEWFVHAYENPTRPNPKILLPIFRPKRLIGKRLDMAKRFEAHMGHFFKNIISDW